MPLIAAGLKNVLDSGADSVLSFRANAHVERDLIGREETNAVDVPR
jgi:hypothetical protein